MISIFLFFFKNKVYNNNNNFRSAEAAELRRYQNQAAEYSKQISDLRRQATNERFDRARKEEENRRYALGKKINLKIHFIKMFNFHN